MINITKIKKIYIIVQKVDNEINKINKYAKILKRQNPYTL